MGVDTATERGSSRMVPGMRENGKGGEWKERVFLWMQKEIDMKVLGEKEGVMERGS